MSKIIDMSVYENRDLKTLRFVKIKQQISVVYDLVMRWNIRNAHSNNDLFIVIAGGVWRGLYDDHDVIDDVDLFVVGLGTQEERKAYIDSFLQFNKEYTLPHESLYNTFSCPEHVLFTFRTITGLKVQLINEQAPTTITELLERFDIRACKIAHQPTMQGRFLLNDEAHVDIFKKQIVLDNIPYPVSTMLRVEKYKKKGYTVSSSELNKIFITAYHQMDEFRKELPDNVYVDGFWNDYFNEQGRRYID